MRRTLLLIVVVVVLGLGGVGLFLTRSYNAAEEVLVTTSVPDYKTEMITETFIQMIMP